ncbi:hypothetical protein [Streptomyces indicus]
MRSADEINRQIRAMWSCPAVRLRPEQRELYEQLVTEWAAAVRGEVAKAA